MKARDNPFRSARIDALAFRDPAVTPEQLLERWRGLGRRGAIVGPHGTGKTTLLAALVARLEDRGTPVIGLRLRADAARPSPAALARALAACGPDGVFCLDGIDGLHAPVRAWLRSRLRGAFGVFVTSHRSCGLPVLHRTRTTPALLAALTAELLGRDADPLRPTLDRLHERTGGNVRDALFALYAEAAAGRLLPPRPTA
jgi:hypothetical protein